MLSSTLCVCIKCCVDTLCHISVICCLVLSWLLKRTVFQTDNMPAVPREKYPEMNWQAADKVAAWEVFKHCMKVIFMADQVPANRQYALILVVGGDEAFNC